MKVLLVITHNGQRIDDQVFNTVTACLSLGDTFDAVVMGYDCEVVANMACQLPGVNQVHMVLNEALQHAMAESSAEALLQVIEGYDYVVFPWNTTAKNILPRLAVLKDISPITDVCEIVDAQVFKRPIYAGNIIETVRSSQAVQMLSIRAASFSKAVLLAQAQGQIHAVSVSLSATQSRYVNATISQSDRPDLSAAKIVVSGGRGLGNRESFSLIYQLADQLGAAVGASRAAVDAGFVSNDFQVGQTGKIIAPDVYVAIGISGAIQHIAGMKDSRVIIAINKDADAPIFQYCDYGLVGDLFTVLPQIQQHLQSSR